MIVAARIPDELKIKIEDICEREGKSVSNLIRELLEEYATLKDEEWRRKKICIKIPSALLEQVQIFTHMGYANDINGVIVEAIRMWLRAMKSEYQRGWKEKLINSLLEGRE